MVSIAEKCHGRTYRKTSTTASVDRVSCLLVDQLGARTKNIPTAIIESGDIKNHTTNTSAKYTLDMQTNASVGILGDLDMK